MQETTDRNALVTPSTVRVRALSKDVYTNYVIEAETQVAAYEALANFARALEGDFGLIESVSPSFGSEDELSFMLFISVAH